MNIQVYMTAKAVEDFKNFKAVDATSYRDSTNTFLVTLDIRDCIVDSPECVSVSIPIGRLVVQRYNPVLRNEPIQHKADVR